MVWRSARGARANVRRFGSATVRRPVHAVEPLERRALLAATGPAAVIDAPDLTAGGGTHHDVTVTYTDPDGVNAATISPEDLTVTGPGGAALTVLSVKVTPTSNAQTVVAVYSVGAPGGLFEASDNGRYAVTLPAGAVADVDGNPGEAATASFRVDVTNESIPMAASIVVQNVTTGGVPTHDVTVVYTSPFELDVSTVDAGDIVVTGPDGLPLTVISATVVHTDNSNDPSSAVTYTVAAPGGVFDPADNGAYTVTLAPNAVRDGRGNPFATATGTFVVAVPGEENPLAAVIGATDLTAAGAAAHTISVVFQGPFGVDSATVDTTDLVVTGPNGDPLTVTAVAAVPPDGPGGLTRPVVVRYTVAPADGVFDRADDGVYTVSLQPGAVTDTHGNPFGPATGTFAVNVPPDTTAPAATVLSFEADPGAATATAVVKYADPSGVETASIDPIDVTVAGPDGRLTVTTLTATAGPQPGEVTVAYTLLAPGGAWDAEDAGRYTVTVNGGAVTDDRGNGVATTAAPFDVPLPPESHGPDLTAELVPATGASGSPLPGAAGRARVRVTNVGDRAAVGRVRIQLLARGAAEVNLVTANVPGGLRPGQSRLVAVRFHHPDAVGTYHLAARADPDNTIPELNEANNTAEGSDTFTVSAPFAQVAPASLGAATDHVMRVRRRMVVPVTVRNDGNATFVGDVNLDAFAAPEGGPSFQFVRLGGGQATRHLVIRSHASRVVRLRVLLEDTVAPGRYRLKVNANPTPTSATDPQDETNAVSGEVLVVSA